jgi:hypothetical protein
MARGIRWLGFVIHGTLILAFAFASPAGAQQVTEDRLPVIRAEIDTLFDQYYGWFSAGQVDVVMERAYTAPMYLGNVILQTRDEVRDFTADLLEQLSAQGYARSEMPTRNICLLSGGFAVVSGNGFRYRGDGSVLGEFGWTYTVMLTEEGWRIMGMFAEPVEDMVFELVRCGE